ncbi:flagellin [Lederbergia galactosidilytica]|uniref:Flagellin n=1 Tax=Lederbergia galactosidilytica TaxID=217031 RepID=A0A0Q9Y269_9BACI|nr:flagellin [Lederbergia galactosidilytica]KRG11706.1 flagellin [Lederbergia galactosidilytica]OAK72323.1 flagellin [Lederbergia galactosidilytica]
MRINHNIQALNAYRNLSQTMASTSKSLEKLSSGLRINRAADDAAGLAISEKMRSQIRGLDMAERNALDAVSLIQTAEGALNETHSILQRMRELSVQTANGTLDDSDREAVQLEIEELIKEVDRIAEKTEFNGMKLLDGETTDGFDFQIGPNNDDQLNVKFDAMDAGALEVNDIDISTSETAQNAITALDKAIGEVSKQRASLGAYQNRLEHTVTNLQTANENLTAAESRIRDLDMAMEMTNFTRNNILNQAGQAMLAQANQLPQGILQLLQ